MRKIDKAASHLGRSFNRNALTPIRMHPFKKMHVPIVRWNNRDSPTARASHGPAPILAWITNETPSDKDNKPIL